MDISKEGLKAILAQKGTDYKIHLITFISYKNNRHECNYPITDLKRLVIFWIMKKFKRYLKGIQFIIIIDHSALKYIFTKNKISKSRREY